MKVLLNEKIIIFDDETWNPNEYQTDYVILEVGDTVEVIDNETEQFKCYLTITEIANSGTPIDQRFSPDFSLGRSYYGIEEMTKKEYKSGPSFFNAEFDLQYISWWIFNKNKNNYVFFGVTNLTQYAKQVCSL